MITIFFKGLQYGDFKSDEEAIDFLISFGWSMVFRGEHYYNLLKIEISGIIYVAHTGFIQPDLILKPASELPKSKHTYTIRVIHFCHECLIGRFITISSAQERLINSGYKKIGESELFWVLVTPECDSKYYAEIIELPRPVYIDLLPSNKNTRHHRWCHKTKSPANS